MSINTGSPNHPLTLKEFQTEAPKVSRGQTVVFFVTKLPAEDLLEKFRRTLQLQKGVIVEITPNPQNKSLKIIVWV